MREQQIVITLKPEQFAQVQKLSKAAGAKSMGIFVRKALLAALGIDAAGKAVSARAPQVNPAELQKLAEDLKRMHIELRELVSEDAQGSHEIAGASDTGAVPGVAHDSVAFELLGGGAASEFSRGDAASGVLHGGEVSPPAAGDRVTPGEDDSAETAGTQHAVPASASDAEDAGNESDVEEGNYSFADAGAGFSDDPLNDLLDHSLMERLQDYLARLRAEAEKQELENAEEVEPGKPEAIDELDEDSSPPAPSSIPQEDEEKSEFQQQIPPELPKDKNFPDLSGGPPPKKGFS